VVRKRVLYSQQYIEGYRNALAEARSDLQEMHAKHLHEHAILRRELDQCRAELGELKTTVLARQHAESELATLYRERELARAQAAVRDPMLPLQ
jgi:hypothetical protein